MLRLIIVAIVFALSLPVSAQQVYKWTDENGQVHYGNVSPPQPKVDNITRDISENAGQATTRRGSVADSYERAARSYRSMRTSNRHRAPEQTASTPAKISYDDQIKIENLNRRINSLSTSTIGSTLERKRQINAAKAELAGIYAKYEMYPDLWGSDRNRSESPAAATSDGSRMNPIFTNDGRWLYPNDPDGNTFHGSDGDYYMREGNQAFNPRTGERLFLH